MDKPSQADIVFKRCLQEAIDALNADPEYRSKLTNQELFEIFERALERAQLELKRRE